MCARLSLEPGYVQNEPIQFLTLIYEQMHLKKENAAKNEQMHLIYEQMQTEFSLHLIEYFNNEAFIC